LLLFAMTAPVLLAGFMGYTAVHRTRTLRQTVSQLRTTHQEFDRLLRTVQTGIQMSGTTLRDYLLDPSDAGAEYRRQLLRDWQTTREAVTALSAAGRNPAPVSRLRSEVEAYLDATGPVFTWTADEKRARSFQFIRTVLLPRRQAVLQLVTDVERLTDENVRLQEQQLLKALHEFEQFVFGITVAVLLSGMLIASGGAWRLWQLEKLARNQFLAVAAAEGELRRLSQQIVSAQEEERRTLSRELHDQVGQMLTGLRMEVSALAKLHSAPAERFQQKVEETRVVLDQTLIAVRDLATGLRPSVLDDLGLEPALKWQAREFSRRFDIPVTVQVATDDRWLTDAQRTAIFRVVQEALTNCARHARPASVAILLDQHGPMLRLTVDDDGIGATSATGLGVLGMKERIRSIGGVLELQPLQPRGTRVCAEIPTAGVAHA
jgi:signal transduction histidine kinase